MSVINSTVRQTCAVLAALTVGAVATATPASASAPTNHCRANKTRVVSLPAAASTVSATISWTCRSVHTNGVLVNNGSAPVTFVVWANGTVNPSAWTAAQGAAVPFNSGWGK